MLLRVIFTAALIVLSYICQTTFSMEMSLGVVAPNLIMILVCSYALLRGRKEGMLVGFFSGLLIDLFFGYHEVVGINTFLYLVIGYVVGMFHEILYLQDILIPIIVVAICDFGYNFMCYVVTFLLRNKLDVLYYVRKIILPELVYTVFLTVFIYRILMLLNRKLEAFEMRGKKEID